MGEQLRRAAVTLPAAVILLLAFGANRGAGGLERTDDSTRSISFEQRLEAQRAIERIYYSYQLGATRPFEEAIPEVSLVRKVSDYLAKSLVLDERWRTPITAQMLSNEMSRIQTSTQLPDRLREVFAALGNDPFLIQETFVRQTLAERLVREAFATDTAIHAEERRYAETLRARLVSGELSPLARDPSRTVVEILLSDGNSASAIRLGPLTPGPPRIALDPESYARFRALAPSLVGEIGQLVEEPGAFVIRVVLEEEPGRCRIATYAVTKYSWDDWWSSTRDLVSTGLSVTHEEGLESQPADAVAGSTRRKPPPISTPPTDTGSLPATCAESWSAVSRVDAPDGGLAVWSGHEMIVWQGGTGGRYQPSDDEWLRTSAVESPEQRFGHTVIWTGNVMTVWGGLGVGGYLDTGGRYDPLSDTWTPTSTLGAPSARFLHSAVWTGSEMIVWGGGVLDGDEASFIGFDTGGQYDPIADSWRPTPLAAAPAGSLGHTAVWTGDEMIVWGGHDSVVLYHVRGARLDPAARLWRPVTVAGAPVARWLHQAVWTGDEMIVWGGGNDGAIPPFVDGPLVSGAAYDPAADRWRALTTEGVPEPRWDYSMVWAGRSLIVWGGASADRSRSLDTGGLYDPVADSWHATTTLRAPEARNGHSAIWTGSEMIVWGGYNGRPLTSGGRYTYDVSLDADGDGYTICGGDCDDGNAALHPAAVDLPGDRLDQNCDGVMSCDPGAAWRNHGRFVRCVVRECSRLASARAVKRSACQAVLRRSRN